MSCDCKHNKAKIMQDKATLASFREAFIKRLTIDSKHNDRRRKDFNQALFMENGKQAWQRIELEMVLQSFDDAEKDYVKTYCDSDSCKGNK